MDEDKTKLITATELKSNLGKYLDYVYEDNEVVITKNGKKALRMTPYITDIERYFTVRERSLDYQYGRKKVSYEEFMEIYEKSDLRMEYINGEIYILSSPNVHHQDISGNLHVFIRNYLKGKSCKVFYSPFDVHFFKQGFKDPDVMQPDLFIACDLVDTINEKGRYMGTPTLVIEILSQSTRSKDMVDKLNTYMLSGVKEYWVIDPFRKIVLVYSFKDYKIDELVTYNKEDTIKSNCFEGLEISLKDVFES
ncbi:MAG: type II toxin-antitoxin system prevent-host-death family antitoxin [Clostridiales bacterium]|nr:type II toxin-antitoxin system prevent-host-death family antitoxin [Clostridiales bacterium]